MSDRLGDRSTRASGVGEALGGISKRALVTEAVATTAVSGSVVVGATVLAVLGVGFALGIASLAAYGLLAGGVLAVAAALCNREGPLPTAAGSVVVVLGVVATAYVLSQPVSDPSIPLKVGPAIFVVAALLAGLGAVATIPGALGDGQWAQTVFRAGAATILPAIVVGWSITNAVQGSDQAIAGVVDAIASGVDVLLAPTGPNANVGGFLALLGLAGLAVAVALRTLPVVTLVAKERRSRVATGVGRARSLLRKFGVASLALALALTAWPTNALHGTLLAAGVEVPLRAVVDASWLRTGIASVASVAVLASAVTIAFRRVARVDGRRVLRVLATTTPGGGVLLAIGFLAPDVLLTRLRIGPASGVVDAGVDAIGASPLALAVLVCLVLGTTTALSVLTTAAGMGFIPNRTAAPSVAAGGVLLVAVAAGVWPGANALATFGAVVASMLVWDVGNYGVDVTAELDGTTSRVVEVLHAGGSAVVGGVLVAVGFAALWASNTLAAGGGLDGPGLLGLVLVVVATLGLMSTLRG